MALLQTGLAKSLAEDYTIDQSLRFDGTSYLTRTPGSAGNSKTWTVSFWTKLEISAAQKFFDIGTVSSSETNFDWQDGVLNFKVLAAGSENTTTSLYRDPSAWYHMVVAVDTTQATDTDRVKIYVNGEQLTDFSATSYPAQDSDTNMNTTKQYNIGRLERGDQHRLESYLAEFYSIDGTAYAASDFGETDSDTNQWKPIDASGLTFGTNGFYLKFEDSADLGNDSSGEGNDYTPTNLAATDQMVDSPTNNFPTFNPLCKITAATNSSTLSEGNLKAVPSGSHAWPGTFAADSGKWYWEVLWTAGTATGGRYMVVFDAGNADEWNAGPDIGWGTGRYGVVYDGNVGDIYNNGTGNITQSGLTTLTDGDIISAALDLDASPATVQFYKNNATIGTAEDLNASASGIWGFAVNSNTNWTWYLNTGSDSSFAGEKTAQGNQDGNSIGDFYYEPPTDFLALCTSNLSDPEIKLPGDNFNTILYSGDDANPRTLTEVGFQPDLTWIKSRTGAYSHQLFDAVRGAGEALYADNAAASYSDSATGHLSAWTADGYTVSGSSNTEELNDTGQDYVAWNWLGANGTASNGDGDITSTVSVNSTAGFSIVKYAGSGTGGDTVGHGLSQTPDLIIIKNRDAITNWVVNSPSMDSAFTKWIMKLDLAEAQSTDSAIWNNTPPGASVFTLGTAGETNRSNPDNYIAYCWHTVEGYSKFGTFEGNSNADGTFIYTGMKPAWLILKNVDGGAEWYMSDSKRSPINVVQGLLLADQTTVEDDDFIMVDYVSNGFKVRSSDSAFNTNTIFYMAFAESPFKYANAR